MKSSTIAVTGASGHIGNVVCRKLLGQGHRVRAMYQSDSRSLEGLPLALLRGSVLQKADLLRLMEGCDLVVHCAAIISINGDPSGAVWQTNTQGPKNVLEVAHECGVSKMVHLSSVHAVEELPLDQPFNESRPYKNENAFVYDHSKAQGEKSLLEMAKGLPVELVILRPSSVVGPFDFKPSEMGKALLDFYHQKIPVLPPGGYDFVDVRDVADSVLAALEKGGNGEVYLLSGRYHSMRQLANLVQKVTGKKAPRRQLPFFLLKLALPVVTLYSKISGAAPLFTIESITALKHGHPNMDHSKAAAQLGHRVRDFETTLRDFYAWQGLDTA